MGVVYSAYDPDLDRKVAIKLLSSGASDERREGRVTRLFREAQAMAKISRGVHSIEFWRLSDEVKELARDLDVCPTQTWYGEAEEGSGIKLGDEIVEDEDDEDEDEDEDEEEEEEDEEDEERELQEEDDHCLECGSRAVVGFDSYGGPACADHSEDE